MVSRFTTTSRVIALTFDAGSDAGATSRILDFLRAQGVVASFGITGQWAEANPALVCRVMSDGHAVINHSYSHPSFTGYSTRSDPLPTARRLEEISRTEAVIAGLGGTTKPWFRPPYGDVDASVQRDVATAGYRYIAMWTVDSLGWKGIAPSDVAERVLAAAAPGAIVLMHVGAASTDVDALPQIIESLRAQGYSFATVHSLQH